MTKIHLGLLYKTDSIFKVLLKDSDGDIVTGATGTYDLVDSGGTSLISGAMSSLGSGWYFFSIADDVSVSPGDLLVAKITMTYGGFQCYGEYELFVEVDRR